MRIKDRLFRLPPCPPYDVEGMESWLEDMAEKGWMLEKDNIFLGVAAFEKAEPAPVRYRLEATERNASNWDDLSGAPDPEAEEMNADFGWEYVARRWQFYIYRSAMPGPELHTDPQVQALAIKALERREMRGLLVIVFDIALILFVHTLKGTSPLLIAAEVGLPLTLLTLLLFLWPPADGAQELIHLGKLKKRLAAGQPLGHEKDWRKGSTLYFVRRLARFLLFLLWLLLFSRLLSADLTDADKRPLKDFPGQPPFATIAGFAKGSYEETWQDLRFDYFTLTHNAFVKTPIHWGEHADVHRADGTVLQGGLYVDYYEARSEHLARQIAAALRRIDRRRAGKWFESLACPDFGLEEAAACRNELHFPCVVLRQGRVVLRAMFYQTGLGEDMPLEQWAGILADSIR